MEILFTNNQPLSTTYSSSFFRLRRRFFFSPPSSPASSPFPSSPALGASSRRSILSIRIFGFSAFFSSFATASLGFPPCSGFPFCSGFPRYRFSRSLTVFADPTASFIATLSSSRISSVTRHRAAPFVVCRKKTPVSYEETRWRSLGGRQCCAPSQKPCSVAFTTMVSPCLCLLFSRKSHIWVSFHTGTTTTKESLSSTSCAASNKRSACCAAANSVSGTNGGFISNDPRVGLNVKKLPKLPKGVSTSGNAEQNRPYRQFRGDANASHPTPSFSFKTSNAVSPSAAWYPAPAMASYLASSANMDARKALFSGVPSGGNGAPPRECLQYSARSFPACALLIVMYGLPSFSLSASNGPASSATTVAAASVSACVFAVSLSSSSSSLSPAEATAVSFFPSSLDAAASSVAAAAATARSSTPARFKSFPKPPPASTVGSIGVGTALGPSSIARASHRSNTKSGTPLKPSSPHFSASKCRKRLTILNRRSSRAARAAAVSADGARWPSRPAMWYSRARRLFIPFCLTSSVPSTGL
mmetsp:Transcript_10404/g.38589  ORF Transcript_10404/g.38589 Transcript_10404/m.38589 type:complete len:530 (-) Transcript_10404:168-1757(-)